MPYYMTARSGFRGVRHGGGRPAAWPSRGRPDVQRASAGWIDGSIYRKKIFVSTLYTVKGLGAHGVLQAKTKKPHAGGAEL